MCWVAPEGRTHSSPGYLPSCLPTASCHLPLITTQLSGWENSISDCDVIGSRRDALIAKMDSRAKPDAAHHPGRGVLLSKEAVLRERERKVTWAKAWRRKRGELPSQSWTESLLTKSRSQRRKCWQIQTFYIIKS